MNKELLKLIEQKVLRWPGVSKKTDENGPGGIGVTGYRLGQRQSDTSTMTVTPTSGSRGRFGMT